MSDQLETHYSIFNTAPNNKGFITLNSSPNKQIFSNSLFFEDDLEIAMLRRKLNEIKKERLKSEKNVDFFVNKISLLYKEEQKIISHYQNEFKKKKEMIRKKSIIKETKTEVVKAKQERKEECEVRKVKISSMKEKRINNLNEIKLSTNLKKINNGHKVYMEKIKLFKAKFSIWKEFEENKKRKAEKVRQSIEAAVKRRRKKEAFVKENMRRNLECKLKTEENIKQKVYSQIEKMEKSEYVMIKSVVSLSPVNRSPSPNAKTEIRKNLKTQNSVNIPYCSNNLNSDRKSSNPATASNSNKKYSKFSISNHYRGVSV